MINNKRKVLVLIPNFLPGYKMGGPLTSIINTIENLSSDFCFEVLTSDRDMGDNKPYDNINFNVWLKKNTYDICYVNSNILMLFRLLKSINSSKADVIYLNSLFHPIFSIFIILSNKIGLIKAKKIILSPRGETYDEALNFKKKKKKIYIFVAKSLNLYKRIYWHASTEFEKQSIIKNMNIKHEMIHVALNLTQKINKEEIAKNDIIQKNNELLHIIFLSRVSKDKNILYTFEVLKKIKSKVVFHIYGPLEDLYIWEICKEKIKNLPKNIEVEYKGTVAKENVKKIFGEYDLMFLPTLAENFGHVIVESLSVGTPVLISDNTPWRDLESKWYGWDFSLNEPNLFVEAIDFISNLSVEEKTKMKIKRREDFIDFLDNPETLEANKELFKL